MLVGQDSDSLLVVEGQITNEEGPFRVKLSQSVPLYNDPNLLYEEHPVYGANVQIFDDQGNAFRLYEEEDGWYETENKQLKGVVGNTYSLTIATPDGIEYESSAVLMSDVPEIEEIHYSENVRTVIEETNVYEENQLSVLVDSKPFEEGIGYLKWEFEETWQFELPTEMEVNHGMCETCPPPTKETVNIDSEKKYCWATENSMSILVGSSAGNSENKIKDFILQTIFPPDDRLNIRYSILVKQYSLNRQMYNYFKKLRKSNEETGGIYEVNPAPIFGNITCCNSNKEALGYFFASAVTSKRIFIDGSEHSVPVGSAYLGCGWTTAPPQYQKYYFLGTDQSGNRIYSTNNYCTDCRVRGTNKKPDFWE
jgi:hypothetical protein